MTVTVMLFARARDLAGTDRLEFDLAAGATIGTLRDILACGILGDFINCCAMAMGDEFVENDMPLFDGAQVAVLPPVSGGEV